MGFMKPYIYRGPFYLVEGQCGVDCIPMDIVGELGLGVGDEVDVDAGSIIWNSLVKALCDYTTNSPNQIGSIELCDGYYGRYSAPGYVDATDWVWGATRDSVETELEQLYGE